MVLFDERNLFELIHPDFPSERLVACRNVELAHRRAAKRESLLQATVKELDKVRSMVHRGPLNEKKAIDTRVRAILKNYRIDKYYEIDIRENGFNYRVDKDALVADITGNLRLFKKGASG